MTARHDGIRCVAKLIPGQLHAPEQVGLLRGVSEGRVKPAHLFVHLAAQPAVPGQGVREQAEGPGQFTGGQPGPPGHHVLGVQGRVIDVPPHGRVLVEGRDHPVDPVIRGDVVTVAEQQQPTLGRPGGGRACARRPRCVPRVNDPQRHPVGSGADRVAAVISRPVVADDDLPPALVGLPGQGVQLHGQMGHPVADGHHHADVHGHRNRRSDCLARHGHLRFHRPFTLHDPSIGLPYCLDKTRCPAGRSTRFRGRTGSQGAVRTPARVAPRRTREPGPRYSCFSQRRAPLVHRDLGESVSRMYSRGRAYRPANSVSQTAQP